MNKIILLSLIAISILSIGSIFLLKKSSETNTAPHNYSNLLQSISHSVNSNKKASWKSGKNHRWDDMDLESIKGQMSSQLRSRKFPKDFPMKEFENIEMSAIPDYFDASQYWSDCSSISEIRDQANCGSCWAVSATEVMSDRICIASQGNLQTRVSAQDLLTCCTACGDGCNGGDPRLAWAYYYNTGLSTGEGYGDSTYCKSYFLQPCDHHMQGKYGPCPSVVPTPTCVSSCDSGTSYKTPYSQDMHKASWYYGLTGDVIGIQNEIMTKGPVQAEFQVYEDFLTYKSGVYHHVSGSFLGLHDIKIIGWGTENGSDYWLCVNSWNDQWGDRGYFKIARGSNECEIESYLVAGLPLLQQKH